MDKETWINYAVNFIVDFATKDGKTFTANDLWPAGLSEPENARWLGNALMRARGMGLLVSTGKSVSKRGHQVPITVWRAA